MDVLIPTARGVFPAIAEGPEGAPVVLLLHGFPDVPQGLAPVQKLLAAAGLRAVAPYLRGYDPAPLDGPWDADTIAADIEAMARTLSPLRPVTLVGHDWGAACSYVAAARFPWRFDALIALSVPHPLAFLSALARDPAQLRRSWYMLFFQPPALAEFTLRRGDFSLIDRLWRAWSPGLTPPPGHLALVKRCLDRSLPAPLAYYRSMLRPPLAAAQRLLDPTARAIRVPTLHLTGAQDGCIGPRCGRGQERYFVGKFRTEIIDGAGHFLMLERPGLVADRVLRHRAEAPGPGRGSG
ncbi:MAG: alpha/beta hydrolase [Polyangiaceae bacterium]|jgi:pimeloyl-ACP methyl ester carboxylesterase|nr:alpha/beta hydrolase [Polyangiaceae bacterium]